MMIRERRAMNVFEAVIEKLLGLSSDKRVKVLEYVERTEQGVAGTTRLKTPRGAAAHASFQLSLKDFKQLRREAWGASTDKELDRSGT